MAPSAALRFKGVKKSFGENNVLTDISFHVGPGEVVALTGENGAGKSTLMNILFGMDVIHSTGGFEGCVEIDDEPVSIKNPNDAMSHGIGMVHQEFMLIPSFTVGRNIKLNRENRKHTLPGRMFGSYLDVLDEDAIYENAATALHRLGLQIDPKELVEFLPVGHKQFVEIAREIDKSNLKILVFDEPTAVLTENEAEKLLDCIRTFAQDGISVLFISHRLDEVMAVANRVIVLRDGEIVANDLTRNLTKERIAALMVGRELEQAPAIHTGTPAQSETPILEMRGLSVDMPGEEVKGIDLRIREGEFFGIGGLAGHGKMAVSNAVAGMYPVSGEVLYRGKPLHIQKPGEALRHGISFVSEDRKGVGLLLDRSIQDNIIFTDMCVNRKHLKTYGLFTQVDTKSSQAVVEDMIRELAIKCVSPKQRTGDLSGGNQQKVCVARALVTNPQVLFVSEPTRGIDIGAKQLLLNYLLKMNRERGMTIVMTSSELGELRTVCQRIAIIADGALQGILQPDSSDVQFALMLSGDRSGGRGEAKS